MLQKIASDARVMSDFVIVFRKFPVHAEHIVEQAHGLIVIVQANPFIYLSSDIISLKWTITSGPMYTTTAVWYLGNQSHDIMHIHKSRAL